MMDNKLSELSKPVAWIKADRNIAENWSCTDPEAVISTEGWHSDYNPLYSQEYVSALLAELEAKDKRIAELELDELAMRASSRAVHEAQENHINQQQDIIESLEKKNVDLGRALGAAEKRLAAPVRLPDPSQDKWLQWSGDYNFRSVAYFSAVKKAVRAAGFTFTVEGDGE